MHLFIRKPSPSYSILILIVILTTHFLPTVRSTPNFLKLHSDQQEDGNLCRANLKPDFCPVKCFRPDPVCGANGVTYWCGCADAHCAGTPVKKLGFCEVGNGGSSPAGQGPVVGSHYLAHIAWSLCLVRASLIEIFCHFHDFF
ncbi:serine protease inhibitor [Forsythia ovata]|uniref:Serine protease inhibitor n=1 Tax=Forsythia ovata TaxID=205694 RepID=A0ABD1X2X2_9LAMI